MAATERTYLTRPNDPPHYVEFAGLLRTRRNKIRQFQCCICAFLIVLFVITMVVTISYSINHTIKNNSTITENSTNSNITNLLEFTRLKLNLKLSDLNSNSLTKIETMEGIEAGNEAIKYRRISDSFTKPLPSPSPDFRHQFAVSTSLQAGELALAAVGEIAATKKIENSRLLLGKPSSMGSYFNGGWAPQDSCKEFANIICKRSKYRTFDGTCNNLNQWGSALSPYRRILPPAYADGINSPRNSVSGKSLPSAREVSLKVHPPSPSSNPSFTVMLAVFGQFLDHDITATAISQGMNGSSLSCCPFSTEHPECFPVKVGTGDPVYDVGGISCMEFVRSAPAPQCKIGPRQQLNQVTAFIDGSTIYGSDFSTANSLREFQGGRLKMQLTPDNRTLLPRSTKYNDGCNRILELKRGRYCFAAGDGRANENLHLTTMHVLWARQHNKLAEKLSKINPSWDDETLYQESRRIVGAQLQHIAYTEFIPIVLGESNTNSRNLKPLKSGFRQANTTINPELANNFAAAAFRFAHTLLPGLMRVADAEKGTTSYVELHRMLFNPYSLYSQGGVAKSVKMATSNVIQKTSTHVTSQLTSHLFEDPSSNKTVPCGLDLVSLNVQRGRDHGLPGYTKWREYCGLKKPKQFSDLKNDLDSDALNAISKLYSSVDDVDLYTGALAEISKSDGIVGPTFTCLIGEQFERSQQGDSFWYENSDQPGSFTPEQLMELRKTSLAKLICDCSDGITQIQAQVMKSEKLNNPIISCEDIPGPSLEAWREVPTLTDQEPYSEEPTNDWLTFKNDINDTVQMIVDFIRAHHPQALKPDYITIQNEMNELFADLRNELSELHPQLVSMTTDSLNDSISNNPYSSNNFITFMNNSLEEARNQISQIEKQPSVSGDWIDFKTNIIKSLNYSIDNLKGYFPTPAEWLAFKNKLKLQIMDLKNQVADIKYQISTINRKSNLQEVVDNEDIDWKNFRDEIIKSVDEIVDKIKDNMPPPGDPNWESFAQNVRDKFTNFENSFITKEFINSSDDTEWENTKQSVVESLDEAIDNINNNKPVWSDYKNQIKSKFTDMSGISSIDKKYKIDENLEWKNFKLDLNETLEKILQDIKDNSPLPGDPSWTDYRMKIMDQFSKFKNDIPSKSRILLKVSEDNTVFDWMTFKSDLNNSLNELISNKEAGKLLPGDSKWAELKNKFKESIDDSKYRIPVMNLSSDKNSSSDWINFRKDLTEAIKTVVRYIKENAPSPESSDWCEFRKNIRKKFADLRKEFELRKSELLIKANDDSAFNDTTVNIKKIDDSKINHTKIDEATSSWVSLKTDLNKTLNTLIKNRKFGNCLARDKKWKEFRNYVNNSISTLKNNIVNLQLKPQGKQLLSLRNDWIDFFNSINKSLADAFMNLEINNLPQENQDLAIFRDSVKDNFAKVINDIEEIKEEWLSKIKKDSEKLEIPESENNYLKRLHAATNNSFSDLKNQVENMKIEPIPFDITGVDWVSFKDSINKTIMNYIESINHSDPNEWIKFKDFVDKSIIDLREQIISLKNVIDEAVKKINEKKTFMKDINGENMTTTKTGINQTISDILEDLSASESNMTNINSINVKEALMKTRNKLMGLSHHQILQNDLESTEKWKMFSKDLNKCVSDVKKKLADTEEAKDDSKWNKYRNSVEKHFKELDDTIKDKKMNLLKMSSSASDFKLSERYNWIKFILIIALIRV